jgi:hypothetical protein
MEALWKFLLDNLITAGLILLFFGIAVYFFERNIKAVVRMVLGASAVVFIVIFFAGIFNIMIQSNPNKPTITPTPIKLPSPSPISSSPIIKIDEISSSTEIIGTETIPMPNCGNMNEYTYDAQVSHQVENTVTLSGQIEAGLELFLTAKLQAYYGIQKNETRIETRTLHLSAAPNTSVDYPVSWKYVWYGGKITVTFPDGESNIYEYRINKIEFIPENPIVRTCPP